MRGFLFALSGLIGILIINQPFFSLLFLLLLAFIVVRTKNKRIILFLCLITVVFSLRTFHFNHLNVSELEGSERIFQGKIIDIPNIDGNYVTFQLKLESSEILQVGYRIKSSIEKQKLQSLQPGMTCRVEGSLSPPSSRQNPGSFDYEQYLQHLGIHWTVDIKKMQNCTNDDVTIVDRIKQYRQKGLTMIEKRFPAESAGIVQALLFGERKTIDDHVLEAYQTLGLIHVLVVSGLHVGVILAMLYWFLLRIGIVRERVNIILLLFLPIYVLLTGAAPSVLRAAFMAAAVLIGLFFKQKIHPLESISMAFFALAFYNPNLIFHTGFQLSFLISFGLIVSSSLITTFFSDAFSRLVAVSIIAELISIPIIIYYFHYISIFSFIVNTIFVPIFTIVVLPLSFFCFFLEMVLHPIAMPFLYTHEKLISLIHFTLTTVESFSLASVSIGQISPIYIAIYFVAIFYFFIQFERNQKVKRSLFIHLIPFLALIVVHFSFPYVNPYGNVTVIDVGQGDSILIELPFRKAVYLIDTGGTFFFGQEEDWQKRRNQFDVGKDIVLPVLKAKGIRKLDKLILTHGDEDHVGGTKALLDRIKIKEVLYGKNSEFEENEKQLLREVHSKKVKISFVEKGVSWREGAYTFHILAPYGKAKSKNDRSIILYTKLGTLSWLFMGDAESEGEAKLLLSYPNLEADILKVGHHGSLTSTSEKLVQQVKPKVALISVGSNNLYGHPHNDVISRLHENDVVIFRTDKHGAIQFRFTTKKGTFLEK